MRDLILALAVLLAGCASSGGSGATEIDPEAGAYQLGDSLIVLQLNNQNFEDALVMVELPEGKTIRLGWIAGQHTRAWTVPMEVSGFITFRIQLMAAQHQIDLKRNDRTLVRCRSEMYFAPGVARRLIIHQPMGTGNFCPGTSTGPA